MADGPPVAGVPAGPGPDLRPDDTPRPAPDLPGLERMVEAVLFASPEPVTEAEIAARLGADPGAALARLAQRYAGRGVTLVRAGGGWAFRTAPDLRHLLARHVEETRRLSRAGIETLAVIAYHEPVTRAEIEDIRGVAVGRGTIERLIAMGWVRLGRRRQAPGRPATFVTTDAFLGHFGLASARDLPGLADLRAAGFLGGPGTEP